MPRTTTHHNCYIIAGSNGAGKTTFATEFLPLYRPLLDTLHFFDNSSDVPHLIFKDEAGQSTIGDAALYEQLRREIPS
jgi:predicted ABC-type ATPase